MSINYRLGIRYLQAMFYCVVKPKKKLELVRKIVKILRNLGNKVNRSKTE